MPSPPSHRHAHRSLFKQRSFSPRSSSHAHKFFINFLIILTCVLLTLFHIQTLIKSSTSHPPWPPLIHNLIRDFELPQLTTDAADDVQFLPLKDRRLAKTAMEGNTWFMSSINDTKEKGEAEYLRFPSEETSAGRLLCVAWNGTINYYALAPAAALPRNAKLLAGLTFISDSYYSYDNLFHGLTAMSPFVAWHERMGFAVEPARWVLYQQGAVRSKLASPWVRSLMEATFGRAAINRIEQLDGEGPSCFKEAVVFRHNQGSMGKERKEKVYDLLRCKARAYCNLTIAEAPAKAVIRLTLLLRTGTRSFKDDAAVIKIFQKECGKVDGCKLKVALPNNLTFCDQVKLMSETDVLASPHGAQLTNMFFMDKNSSIMEFFPRGWRELAGVGQYVYRWVADWSRMRHHGAWYDPGHGERECPINATASSCFSFYKNSKLGHDEAFFSNWTARVLGEMRLYKLDLLSMKSTTNEDETQNCKCG
ncbi:hypothetical protein Cni_G02137 [Canna indica]|uniref:Glycosyltransferase 61 catalytic domain-containing protein n=1 Tax=Canna indica TaxID=4628 RepID=A0AAQ3JRY2_9LILI|nr:hypothetical protein Cni_G02136 [Canna indica]WOK93440.1 hypothetical protein Cni_G02137 [Canna indica]